MKPLLKIAGFVFLGIVALASSLTIMRLGMNDTASTSLGSAESEPAPTPQTTPAPMPIQWTAVTANEILRAYDSNEIAGQQQFAFKPLEVTGRIRSPDYAPLSDNTRYRIRLVVEEPFAFVAGDSLDCEIPVAAAPTA